jgi:hypothetical protein
MTKLYLVKNPPEHPIVDVPVERPIQDDLQPTVSGYVQIFEDRLKECGLAEDALRIASREFESLLTGIFEIILPF